MNSNKPCFRTLRNIGAVLLCALGIAGCVTTSFRWQEEVLLHDGRKMIVEREDIYNPRKPREIGQGPRLEEHRTIFTVPDTNHTVIWESQFNPKSDLGNLNLISLDFLNGIPYAATTILGSCAVYNKFLRPNPPYVFFKYLNGWQQISIDEFPEKFQLNLIVTGSKKNNRTLQDAQQQFGYVSAEMVAKINREPGKPKAYYSLFRTPIDLFGVCPQYSWTPRGTATQLKSTKPSH